jgi:hypothetical protein
MPRRSRSLCLIATALLSTVFTALDVAAQRPPMTPAKWREDLRFAADSFLARDRSFSPEARERYRGAVAALADSAERLTDAEIIVGLARAVALADNAHTRLYLLRNRSELRRLPVRVWWFSDGLFITRTQPGLEALLGARVLRICGHPVDEVRRAVRPLYAANDAWALYISSYTMTSPEVLEGLHLCAPGTSPSLTVVDRAGRRGERSLESIPLRLASDPTEAWWDLSPLHPGVQGPWASLLPSDPARLPLYLRDPLRPLWMEYLATDQVLYIQHNRADAPQGESMAAFGDRVLAALETNPLRKVVVDERFNTGGNLQIARPFMQRLAEATQAKGIRLYVISGRATFSAGLTHLAQLRQWGHATLVGEGPGEGVEFWAEGGNLLMPNSRLTLHFADKVHSYGAHKQGPRSPYLDTELFADRVTPEIEVRMSSREYFSGRDPFLEAVLRAR